MNKRNFYVGAVIDFGNREVEPEVIIKEQALLIMEMGNRGYNNYEIFNDRFLVIGTSEVLSRIPEFKAALVSVKVGDTIFSFEDEIDKETLEIYTNVHLKTEMFIYWRDEIEECEVNKDIMLKNVSQVVKWTPELDVNLPEFIIYGVNTGKISIQGVVGASHISIHAPNEQVLDVVYGDYIGINQVGSFFKLTADFAE